MVNDTEVIIPDWKVPSNVKAFTTLRKGGFSSAPFDSFNLAAHVQDDSAVVAKNRALLQSRYNLPTEPLWLEQTHSTIVVKNTLMFDKLTTENLATKKRTINADASWTNAANRVCAILTADCLPIFLYHQTENSVAAIHAGWRGLADGIIEKTVQQMTMQPCQLMAWFGPAISQNAFEVGEEVMRYFCDRDKASLPCFKEGVIRESKQHYQADIYKLAQLKLEALGVTSISGGDYCTASDKDKFFSYRRDTETGRMANLIWMAAD